MRWSLHLCARTRDQVVERGNDLWRTRAHFICISRYQLQRETENRINLDSLYVNNLEPLSFAHNFVVASAKSHAPIPLVPCHKANSENVSIQLTLDIISMSNHTNDSAAAAALPSSWTNNNYLTASVFGVCMDLAVGRATQKQHVNCPTLVSNKFRGIYLHNFCILFEFSFPVFACEIINCRKLIYKFVAGCEPHRPIRSRRR